MTVSCHLTPPSAPTHQRVTGGGSYTHFADEEIEDHPFQNILILSSKGLLAVPCSWDINTISGLAAPSLPSLLVPTPQGP